jgi:hypothetical protein
VALTGNLDGFPGIIGFCEKIGSLDFRLFQQYLPRAAIQKILMDADLPTLQPRYMHLDAGGWEPSTASRGDIGDDVG